MTASAAWAEALREWAIPDEILSAAPESPWVFPVEVFAAAARQAEAGPPTATHRRVAEALPRGGVLLDVGCGAGAASLPVAPPAARIVAVDEDRRMLEALAGLAGGRVAVELVHGRWPDVAPQAGEVDVVVCANVVYNVADLGPFLEALTAAARHRVVLELSADHPQSPMSPLWQRFWGLPRPTRPSASDAEAVIREVTGVAPSAEHWTRASSFVATDRAGTVAWVRRRLCLPPDRDQEVAAALDDLPELVPVGMVTLWWGGRAGDDGGG